MTVKRWRRGERERLIALRQGDARRTSGAAWGERDRDGVARRCSPSAPGILGVYWPFRAEFDPRPLIDWAVASGRTVALPVVIDKKGPLEYRAWRPGETLVDGVWNIPVPEKRDIVVAGDRAGAAGRVRPRLLSARLWRRLFRPDAGGLSPRPLAIGVGFEFQALETIHPQSSTCRWMRSSPKPARADG